MTKTVAKVDHKPEPGFLYFIDKQGDVSKIKRNDGHVLGRQHEPIKVHTIGIKKRKGYMYFMYKDGTIKSRPLRNAKK